MSIEFIGAHAFGVNRHARPNSIPGLGLERLDPPPATYHERERLRAGGEHRPPTRLDALGRSDPDGSSVRVYIIDAWSEHPIRQVPSPWTIGRIDRVRRVT
jgi:hypothetical protein